jgi:hypothetical protein
MLSVWRRRGTGDTLGRHLNLRNETDLRCLLAKRSDADFCRHQFSPVPHGSSSAALRQTWIRVIIAGDRLPTTRRTFVCATVKRLPQVTAEV